MTEETRTASLLEAAQVQQTLEQEIAALERLLPQCPPRLAGELRDMTQARRTILDALRGEIARVAVPVPEAARVYLPAREEETPSEPLPDEKERG